MSWAPVILDFDDHDDGTVADLNRQFDNGVLWTESFGKKLRMCVSMRAHDPFWKKVDQNNHVVFDNHYAKAYFPPNSAPPI